MMKFTPMALCLTRAWPVDRAAEGRFDMVEDPGPPVFSKRMAFMALSLTGGADSKAASA